LCPGFPRLRLPLRRRSSTGHRYRAVPDRHRDADRRDPHHHARQAGLSSLATDRGRSASNGSGLVGAPALHGSDGVPALRSLVARDDLGCGTSRPHRTLSVTRMRRPLLTGLALGVAVAPRETLAHAVGAGRPNDLWSAWTFDPLVWAGLGAAVLLYGVGLGRIWRRAGIGRRTPFMRASSFAGGVLCLFLALV